MSKANQLQLPHQIAMLLFNPAWLSLLPTTGHRTHHLATTILVKVWVTLCT